MQFHEPTCSYISYHTVPWACKKFHELAWSFISLHAVWAANKNIAVLAFEILMKALWQLRNTCYQYSPVCRWVYRWPCVCQRQFRWWWGTTCRQQHREHTSPVCMKMTDVKTKHWLFSRKKNNFYIQGYTSPSSSYFLVIGWCPDLHMMRLSSARGQWSLKASMAVSGMVRAVSRSDTARFIIRIVLGKIKLLSFFL